MYSIAKRFPAGLLCLCLILSLLCFGPSVRAEGDDPILAERVDGADLRPGDRIVIVCEATQKALATRLAGTRLGADPVELGNTATRQVLTGMREDTAVLEIEAAGEDTIYLKCAAGYLTSAETGNGVYYAAEPELCSAWRFEEGGFLYNPNAAYTKNGRTYRNYYLEYYASANYFTTYGKSSSSKPEDFTLSFFRLGNSKPEEELLEADYFTLPVFETSDIHGCLADTSGNEPQYRLAYIADKVNDARGRSAQARPDRVVLLDGGDIYEGSTMSNLLQGQCMAAAYQLMDYDAVTIGNHEFDWWIENTVDADGTMMDSRLEGAALVNEVPVVVSNILHDGEKIDFAEDYIILEKTAADGAGNEVPVRIAVIGFAGEYSSSILYDRFSGAGYTISLDYAALNALADELESSGQCDATILLTHEEAAYITAGLGEGSVIDLVLGGHTHYNALGVSGGVPYLQPAGYAAAYAYAELAFTVEDGVPAFEKVTGTQTVSVTKEAGKLTKMPENAEELEPALVELTDTALSAVAEVLQSEIGYITMPSQRYVYLPDSGDRATTCGNWMASIFARAVGADVAFINGGGMRTDLLLPEGEDRRTVTYSDIYTMFPFDNKIYCFELTYEELLHIFDYAMTKSGSTLYSQVRGVTCYFKDGAVQALVSAGGEPIWVDGEWQDGWKDKKLRVAMSDYVATTRRPAGELDNPAVAWCETERLVSSSAVDNQSAIEVLKAEAAASGGHLTIDDRAWYLNRAYEPPAPPVSGTLRYFIDVPENAWYAEAADYAAARGLFRGVDALTFAPDLPMTRAMLVTVLYRLEGSPAAGPSPFADVPAESWCAGAVSWAAEKGLVQGTGKGFAPQRSVTREQLAAIFFRYVNALGLDASRRAELTGFADGEQTASWAREAMEWAVGCGLFRGNAEGCLNPRGSATRAEVAVLMQRLAEMTGK